MKTVAVISGKGGVGKSALACSVASIISRDEKRVLLFDGNLGFSNCDIYSGVELACTLGHVVRDNRELRDAVMPTVAGFDLISGGSGWSELALLDRAGIEKLVANLKAFSADYDHVVIDCGTGLGDRMLPYLEIADAAMLVTSGEATSLMDSYALIKNIWETKPDLVGGLVVNQVAHLAQGKTVGKEMKGIVGQFLSKEIQLWGSVRHDTHVLKACADRKVFAHCSKLAPASQDLIDIANTIMGLETPEVVEEVSMLGKIKSVFGKKAEADSEEVAQAA